MLAGKSISRMRIVMLIISLSAFIALLLVTFQSYFHSSELQSLVEKAEENNLEYEVIIHNPLTNSYSFRILND
ncbi:hypothetical protein AC622_18095 [Bacillus sp. FJAT-27916]|nr:hypothetical protein AC622_18095 [Bacillus sp. FJAT-27916]